MARNRKPAGQPAADSGRNRRRRAAGVAAAAWHRVFLRQSRHRFSADRRGLRARQGERGQGAAPRAGAAREPRRRHGARRLPDDRGAAGADGARQRRHRQHHQPAGQCRARPRAAAADGGALADHGGGRVRGAQPADPLGAGDVRPGRHGARVRQVGLRAAQPGPGRPGGGARGGSGDGRAAGPRVPDAAARAAVGAGRERQERSSRAAFPRRPIPTRR